jgi:hypothetical protein
MKALALATLGAALTACLPPKVTAEGPSITFDIDPTAGFQFDQASTNPYMEPDSTTGNYEFTISVEADFGETKTEGSKLEYEYSPVNELSGSIMPPGVTLTEADFTFDPEQFGHSRTFTGKMMYTIPGAMVGGTVTFHMEATDDAGLASNVIDFTAMLRP